jgi:hypothetical protein
MSAHLLIRDGSPWWLSPDIWTVPGIDPNGDPGSPAAGEDAWLWARVSNIGDAAASGARVDFYQTNPSAQMVAGVASFIGSGFADLAAGETKDVMCRRRWRSLAANGARECLLAVAHGAGDNDPIPDPLPNGYPFQGAAHDQAAQLNLGLLRACVADTAFTLFVNAIGRAGKRVTVSVEFGAELDRRVLGNMGLRGLCPATEHHVRVTLRREAICHGGCKGGGDANRGERQLELEMTRAGSVPVYVSLRSRDLPRGQFQLVHVVERCGGTLIGGVSCLVANTA